MLKVAQVPMRFALRIPGDGRSNQRLLAWSLFKFAGFLDMLNGLRYTDPGLPFVCERRS